MKSSLIKIRMRKCPKSIARTEVALKMNFCDRQASVLERPQYDLQLVLRDVVLKPFFKSFIPKEFFFVFLLHCVTNVG